ncbi:hypothetical protein CTZ27_21060 [Streptomyces griseocarneus]|nr:hypothetical protein CTZ27_21060 [Streptomyces griseocarneus]
MAPAVATVLLPVLAYVDFSRSGYPAVWELGLAVPCCFVAGAWAGVRARYKRAQRVVLGLTGCCLAYFYSQILLAVLMPVAIVLWLIRGDG